MQVFALSLMLSRHDLSFKVLLDFAISLPALVAGTVAPAPLSRRRLCGAAED
jgi:uncharacterized protein